MATNKKRQKTTVLGSAKRYLSSLIEEGAVDAGDQDVAFAIIGSKALRKVLPDTLELPPTSIPAYVSREEREKLKGDDFDLIGTPKKVLEYLEALEDQGLVEGGFGVAERRRVVVSLKDGATLDIELVLPLVAFNVEGLDGKCSCRLIVESKNTVGQVDLPGEGGWKANVPSLEIQYAVRKSHIFFPIKWRKHIEILHFLLNKFPDRLKWKLDEMVDEEAIEIGKTREREWIGLYGIPGEHINLNKTNEDFFGGTGMIRERMFNHDKIHELVAHYRRPLYERFKKDQSKAMLSKAMFEQASLSDQLKLAREECFAIALERFLLPKKPSFVNNPEEAYLVALERVSTTLTKGWFRDFVSAHYPALKRLVRDLLADVRHIEANLAEYSAESTTSDTTDATTSMDVFDEYHHHDTATNSVYEILDEITDAPHSLSKTVVETLESILKHSTKLEHKRVTNSSTSKFIMRKNENSPPLSVSVTEKLVSDGWTQNSTRGKAEIHIILNNSDTLLHANVFRKTHSYEEWDDSGCEWGGGEHSYWVKETKTEKAIVARNMNESMTRLFGNEPPKGLTQTLFVSFLMYYTGMNTSDSIVLAHDIARRHISRLVPEQNSYFAPKSNILARVWENKQTEIALPDTIRTATSAQITFAPPRSMSPEILQSIIDALKETTTLEKLTLLVDVSPAMDAIVKAICEMCESPLEVICLSQFHQVVFNRIPSGASSSSNQSGGRPANLHDMAAVRNRLKACKPAISVQNHR